VIYPAMPALFLQLAQPSTSTVRGPTNDVSLVSECAASVVSQASPTSKAAMKDVSPLFYALAVFLVLPFVALGILVLTVKVSRRRAT
jgi:hypothetical protein